MKTLKALQENFQACVLEKSPDMKSQVRALGGINAESRLQIYRNAYYSRLIEILGGEYTVLREVIGPKAFDAMARDYLDAFPSHHFSVRQIGKNLVKFLDNTEHCDSSYSELAAFEYVINRALLAKEAPVLTMEDLSQVPPEQWGDMRLRLHFSVQLIKCRFNTMLRWKSVNAGEGDLPCELLPQPVQHLVWRRDREAYYCSLSPEETCLINAIVKQESFASLCEIMLRYFDEDEVVQWVASTLQTWLTEGVFNEILLNCAQK